MVTYEVYSYDKMKGYELIGILPERRKDPKRITRKSILNWGRMVLGDGGSNNIIFIQITTDDTTGKIIEGNMDPYSRSTSSMPPILENRQT